MALEILTSQLPLGIVAVCSVLDLVFSSVHCVRMCACAGSIGRVGACGEGVCSVEPNSSPAPRFCSPNLP